MKYLKIFEDLPGIVNGEVNSWINVKIDNDLPLRISRYTRAIDEYTESNEIEEKLEVLSNPDKFDGGIQYSLSIIMLLQYLKEIRMNFNPQTSGFLFEGFIGGLIHLEKRLENYGIVDLKDNKYKYQIKFYDEKSQIKYKSGCDYYIIAVKKSEFVYVWVLSKRTIKNVLTDGGNISISQMQKVYIPFGKLDLNNIDNRIKKLSKGIKKKISSLYDNISELNYNIETIITGVDKNNNVVDIEDIDRYYEYSEENILKISQELSKVKGIIKSAVKRKLKNQ